MEARNAEGCILPVYRNIREVIAWVDNEDGNGGQWYKENSYYLDNSYDPFDQLKAIKVALDTSRLALGVLYKNPIRRSYSENVRIYNEDKRPVYQRDLDKEKLKKLFESYR